MSVFKFLGFGSEDLDRSLDNLHLPAYTGHHNKSTTKRSVMKCKICGEEISTPAKDDKETCCNKPACQEDFADWLDNTVRPSSRKRNDKRP